MASGTGNEWNAKVRDLFSTRIRIGVTGFSRAGKTVFMCALAQALLTAGHWSKKRGLGPLAEFGPFERGEFGMARIRHGNGTNQVPDFPFKAIRDALASNDSRWPERTSGISRLDIEIDTKARKTAKSLLERSGLAGLGYGRIHLELIDYPGEWLIDLPMLNQSYPEWSSSTLELAQAEARQASSQKYLTHIKQFEDSRSCKANALGETAELWAEYLKLASNSGLAFNQPGLAVCPDTMHDSQVSQFAPLPAQCSGTKLWQEMEKRFERYKKEVIQPFYRDHFSKIDRQIVLVDLLKVLESGEPNFNDLLKAQRALIPSFNYGKGGILEWLIGARTTRVLFAATKADHVVRSDRQNLSDLLRRMLVWIDANGDLKWSAKAIDTMAICSIRATMDYKLAVKPHREILVGKPGQEPEDRQWDPGCLPLDMPPDWPSFQFKFYQFEPRPMPEAIDEGFPSIYLGRALDFLIGEDFQ